jgi:ATP-dependent Lon protease
VRKILAEHYVHRSESELVKSTIKERGRHRIIDKVTVSLNEKADVYEAVFTNLGIGGVVVESATIKAHPKLLVGGVWCICDIEYLYTEDARVVPWVLGSLKPIQLSKFNVEQYLEARRGFTTDEWIDLLMQSIGFNPELFTRRAKFFQLVRLIPFVERNYNLVELGPKGTGKSHIFSEFSPHGMLISGGEVTVPKLFVNNSNGRIGLVGYWDVVAFDEFAGRKKRTDKALVDIMKNYMANKTFSRGIETLGAEASMVFVGNTSHTVPYMLKNSDLFDELPEAYHDPAYLDRLHHYIPGWEVDIIRGEMFSTGYGFVVDYIAEVLKSFRAQDYSDRYQQHFTLSPDISTRDRDGIHKTFSGLMKILYPAGAATKEEIEEILRYAIEGRKRVKDQILRIDSTMAEVKFGYLDTDDTWHDVATLEEGEYPAYYHRRYQETDVADMPPVPGAPSGGNSTAAAGDDPAGPTEPKPEPELFQGHREYHEGDRGVSYESLLVPYLKGASLITIVDPYVRMFHQARNLMELIDAIAQRKDPADEVTLKLITVENQESPEKTQRQLENLFQIKQSAATLGVVLDVDFVDPQAIHDRSITTDTGWKILLGRGLDIFQRMSDSPFELATKYQKYRELRSFSITYLRDSAPGESPV